MNWHRDEAGFAQRMVVTIAADGARLDALTYDRLDSACDLYEFHDGQLIAITSYNVEL